AVPGADDDEPGAAQLGLLGGVLQRGAAFRGGDVPDGDRHGDSSCRGDVAPRSSQRRTTGRGRLVPDRAPREVRGSARGHAAGVAAVLVTSVLWGTTGTAATLAPAARPLA